MADTLPDPVALAVDVGGTFTDVVVWDGTRLSTGKRSTTVDQSDAVIAGAAALTERPVGTFLHGTTVATNALLERKGARTALVTSEGFGDVLQIGRQNRPSLYDSFADRPEPLVEGAWRFEVARSGALTLPQLPPEAEAVAVSLLYGYADDERESAIGDLVRGAGIDAVSLSSVVAPEFREFERMSTTVLNAYLGPVTSRYLERLVGRAGEAGLGASVGVMRSSGGLVDAAAAAALPVAVLLSGPAGGVVAAAALGTAHGRDTVISFDMGGTSTDVCRIEGGVPEITYGRDIDGFPCLMPSVAIHTVGAGGGSLGWVDEGGSLRVGPQSAGAHPGPASYGRGGTVAAVTDANVALGRIDPAAQLAGRLRVRPDLARTALLALGEPIGLDTATAALGIVAVVEEVMAGALRRVSVEEGADPREATLVAFGGAGGLHAASLAKRLDMSSVLVPAHAGVFSAVGLLLSPPRVDAARTVLVTRAESARLAAAMGEVAASARARLRATAGIDGTVQTSVDVRYIGQSHELNVPFEPSEPWERLAERFHRAHQARNGFARRDDAVEAVTVRAVAVGPALLAWDDIPGPEALGDAIVGRRSVVVEEGDEVDAEVVRRDGLVPGDELIGPAVVEETEATTFIAPGERVTVLDDGTLEVTW